MPKEIIKEANYKNLKQLEIKNQKEFPTKGNLSEYNDNTINITNHKVYEQQNSYKDLNYNSFSKKGQVKESEKSKDNSIK
jgi:hypothetical protein